MEREDPFGWSLQDEERARGIGVGAEEEDGDEDLEDEEDEDEDEDLIDGLGLGDGGDGALAEVDVDEPEEHVEVEGNTGPIEADQLEHEADDGPAPQPPPSQQTPRKVVAFGGRAGEVVTFNEDEVPMNHYQTYEAELPENPDPGNIYHPFSNKLSWELASWAKTYAIGANALTALLKILVIAGVRPCSC